MTKIQLRRDTAANWSTNNPTPSAGEPCFETDTGKLKIGDGITAYNSLPYQGGTGDVTSAGNNTFTGDNTFTGKVNIAGGVLTVDGFANSDLSNLTEAGEKHFLNKSQVTNCILEAPNGVASYSGNTITVKQGLKVLIPNGRNADGTLKNIELTLSNDKIFTNTASYNSDFYLFIVSDGSISSYGKNVTHLYKYLGERPTPASNLYVRCYVLETNKWYTSNNGQPYKEQYLTVIGSFGTNDGNTNIGYLDNFNPTQILTYNDRNEISGWGMPSNKYIDLTLGASGTVYTAPADGWVFFTVQGWGFCNLEQGSISVYNSFTEQKADYYSVLLPVLKGTFKASYGNVQKIAFRFIYAEGSK